MVKYFSIFILGMMLLCHSSYAQEASVSAEVNVDGAFADQPLKGTVTVTHDKSMRIDNTSFRIDKDSLPVKFVREIKISPNDPLVLSIYNFTLPGKSEGLYALPSISVKVEDATVQSTMSSYVVNPKPPSSVPSTVPDRSPAPDQPPPQQTAPDLNLEPVKPSLRLEASIEGKKSLYPGQRTKLVYRYYFSGDIALTKEKLPLLDAEGFIKIGEKEIVDSSDGAISIRTISQVIEAVKPGKFTFEESVIEGRSYQEDVLGNPLYKSDETFSSKAGSIAITVLPFPLKNKPASFNGAVGQFTFATTLASSPEMMLGDEFSLALEITGEGNLKNIRIPDLCCQPGFSGFFRLNDLPPTESIKEKAKTITAKLRPLNPLIKTIPSIEFSFFDPSIAEYTVLRSEEIPIFIKPNPQYLRGLNKDAALVSLDQKTENSKIEQPTSTPPAIDLKNGIMPLRACDLYNKLFGNWWSLMILPLGFLLFVFQKHLKEYLVWKRGLVRKWTSEELFLQAISEIKQGKVDFNLLNQSFKLELFEMGILSSVDIPDNQLPEDGPGKQVKDLFNSFDEQRFSGRGSYEPEDVYRLSRELMDKILREGNPS